MGKIKVLFVDDDIALGHVVTLALNAAGYEMYYQSSLIAIQAVIRELHPDIILLDVEIGNKDGIEATPMLKRMAPEIPVLFVSSHVESSKVVKALEAGGMGYLKKPFEMEELLAYIGRYTRIFRPKGIEVGKLMLRVEENILAEGEVVIKQLSAFEGKLLKLLALNMNEMVSRSQIERELWEGKAGNEQSLNNYVAKIRKYLAADAGLELITFPKVGYKLVCHPVSEE